MLQEGKTMQKENDSEGAEKAVSTELPIEQAEKLSTRDSLEVAIQAHKEPDAIRESDTEKPRESAEASPEGPKREDKTLNPPAEWSEEEKADFKASSQKSQEAALRLHRSRHSTLEEIKRNKAELQREAEEVRWAKDVVKEITPFLKVRGEKGPTHEQVIKAVKLVNEVDADTPTAVVEILKARGVQSDVVDKVKQILGATNGIQNNFPDEKIKPLQDKLNHIEGRLAQEDQARMAGMLNQAWTNFEQTKNAAGSSRFPDIGDNESGLRLASSIGSLVSGQHQDSVGFFAYVRARIPGASPTQILEEGYKWFGGRVDESETPKTQNTQKHIVKSSRAASSIPGGRVSGTVSGPKKLDRRSALKEALRFHREAEGA